MDSEAVGLAVDHLLEKFSDNSEAEIGLIAKKETRKRKHGGSQTDISCSSSRTGSPLNIPYCLGFIGKEYLENDSGEEWNSDGSRPRSISRLPGYHSATTAVVSDSEDEVDFPIDVTDLDTFSVEYEPPETNSEDDDDDDNDSNSDEEQVIIIPSSSEDEDPGADGGDEYDVDSDSDDSWECAECWTMNHPLTTKCLMCWKERKSQMPLTLNSLSDINVAAEPSKASNPSVSDTKSATNVLLEKTAVSLSRSSSSCSSSTQASSDSGICVSSCETDVNDCIVLSSVVTTSQRPLQNEPSKINPLQIIIEPLQNEPLLNGPSKSEPSQGGPSENEPTKNEALLNGPTKNEPLQDGPSKNRPSQNEPLQDEALQDVPSKHEPSQNEPLYTKTNMTRNDLENVPSDSSTVINNLNLCVICSVEPRNASIIHGRSGHQVCCITCAEKLKADRKRCPVCRRRIHLVIKNFL